MKNSYFIDEKGEVQGPLTQQQLQALFHSGRITATTKICEEGTENWQPYYQAAEDPAPKIEQVAKVKSNITSDPKHFEVTDGFRRKLILSSFYRIVGGLSFVMCILMLVLFFDLRIADNRWNPSYAFYSLWSFFSAIFFLGVAQVLDQIAEIAENTKRTAANTTVMARTD